MRVVARLAKAETKEWLFKGCRERGILLLDVEIMSRNSLLYRKAEEDAEGDEAMEIAVA